MCPDYKSGFLVCMHVYQRHFCKVVHVHVYKCVLHFPLYLCHKGFVELTTLESCEEGDESVRLVEGSTMDSSEGTVEICIGVYVPVCGFTWGMAEAEVVCQQLGFQGMHLVTCVLDDLFKDQ